MSNIKLNDPFKLTIYYENIQSSLTACYPVMEMAEHSTCTNILFTALSKDKYGYIIQGFNNNYMYIADSMDLYGNMILTLG